MASHSEDGQLVDGVDERLPGTADLSGRQVDEAAAGHVGAELAARSRRSRVDDAVARGAVAQPSQRPRALVAEVERPQRADDDVDETQRVQQAASDARRTRQVVADRAVSAVERRHQDRAAVAFALPPYSGHTLHCRPINADRTAQVGRGEQPVEELPGDGMDVAAAASASHVVVQRNGETRRCTTVIHFVVGPQRGLRRVRGIR